MQCYTILNLAALQRVDINNYLITNSYCNQLES